MTISASGPEPTHHWVRVKHRPLPPRSVFVKRLLGNTAVASIFIAFSLGLGAWGYHRFDALPWIDALLNAAMILTGMGPVATLTTPAAKLFATAYALYSGVAFLTSVAVLLAPVVQRFLHKFHLDLSGSEDQK
jgi:hypothetical protein